MTNNQLTGERLTDSDLEDLICELEAAGFYRRQLICLVELQELRSSYLALRGENEDLQAQLYEAENQDAAELQERRKVNADLTMWVKRLGYSLKRAKPDSKLPGNAMAYLNAKGLISVEDILR